MNRPPVLTVVVALAYGALAPASLRPALAARHTSARPAAARPVSARPSGVSPQVEEFFGKDAVAGVASATSVEIARLRKDRTGEAYTVDSVQKPAGDLGRAFRSLLIDHATYDFPSAGESDAKLCGTFEPAVVVRFARNGKSPVDVILSLTCIEGGMATGPKLPKKLMQGTSYDGWPKFRAHMGPQQLRVLALLVRAFPKDIDIRAFLDAAQGN